ncbi:MAG: dCTP deaminase [Bacteroidales bacterium]|nr:dCTP deaminase [Bacteroidales bacterium]
MENDRLIIKNYIFEIVERISRFYIHLDEIKNQFYVNEDNKISDKLIFINSYIDCLVKYFDIIKDIYHRLENAEKPATDYINYLKDIIININQLHKQLGHLPRPSEPLELKRFARIIEKHVINLNKAIKAKSESSTTHFLIYLSEEIGETTYIKDPLLEYKDQTLNKSIKDYNKKVGTNISTLKNKICKNDPFHISIPRIDANNPCRWPTLLHEVAHKIYKKEYFNNRSIEKDFLSTLDSTQETFVNSLSDINIESWLIECWCDLFACLTTGPVFWFSQFSAFIFQEKNNYHKIDEYYPNALFRLTLIQRILVHRFPNIFSNELNSLIRSAGLILNTIDNSGFSKDDNIRQLFLYFRVYFLNYFFNADGKGVQVESPALNSHLLPMIKYTKEINTDTISELIESLQQGYPIPSKAASKSSLIESPAYVQEILLAAWMYRNKEFKDNVFKVIEEGGLSTEKCLQSIVINFRKFDKSILRSIQVSEWFDLLIGKVETIKLDKILSKTDTANPPHGSILLNDYEIIKYIKDDQLKIIPIINIDEQLGSTSFDIRLGTSFQIYLHTKYGIIDFTNPALGTRIHNSKMIDLDFLESITISPGQFILGHSMEYLKLPSDLAGQVEGRSSFARLGLQIHMTASFIDPGFEGVLTFEIYNAGPNPVKLFPGLRIAQLRFLKVISPVIPYNRNLEAKYNGLLSHNDSKQFKDYEIEEIKKELSKI